MSAARAKKLCMLGMWERGTVESADSMSSFKPHVLAHLSSIFPLKDRAKIGDKRHEQVRRIDSDDIENSVRDSTSASRSL
jgi:hypothetical protein